MPQNQRYGRQSSRYDREDERDRGYGRGGENWRDESRSYRSSGYESEGDSSGYDNDRRQDRDYQGTLRAGDYGRYEEEDNRSYSDRFGRGGRGSGREYGEPDLRGGYGRGGYRSGSYGNADYGSSYGGRSRSYGNSDYGSGSGGSANYNQGGGNEGGFGSYVSDYERRYGGGQTGGGYAGAERGYVGRDRDRNYGGRDYGNRERDWWDRATDEVSSWFGDRDAGRRREMDQHRGRGPKNYTRSDDRIREDVSDRLTDDPLVDASEIEVTAQSQEVTLTGTVSSRNEKRLAEECAESVSGVKHVQNNLRVRDRMSKSGAGGSSTTFGGGGTTTM